MDTFKETKKIYNVILRISKRNSSFLYFTLEANENIAFYSTVVQTQPCDYRDIDIKCTIDLKDNLTKILEHFSKENPYEVLSEQILIDSNSE